MSKEMPSTRTSGRSGRGQVEQAADYFIAHAHGSRFYNSIGLCMVCHGPSATHAIPRRCWNLESSYLLYYCYNHVNV